MRTRVERWLEEDSPPADGLRGLPEICRSLWRSLKQTLRDIPGWFRPPPATSQEDAGAEAVESGTSPTPLSRVGRTVSVALGAALVMFSWAILLAWLDPFGLNRNSGQYSEHLNARLEAPFYNSRAQGDIVIVLITPEALEDRGYAWPPRYEYYADAVRRILYDEPRAVFVDVLVRQARTEDSTLAYARTELDFLTRETGIPVLFATETPAAPSLFSGAYGVDIAPVAWQAAGSDYPLRLGDHNIVPWSRGDVPDRALTDSERESVALKLYRHACPGMLEGDPAPPDARAPLPGCHSPGQQWSLPAAPAPLVVEWGQQRPWPWGNGQVPPGTDPNAGLPENACFASTPQPGAGWRWTSAFRALVSSLRSGVSPDVIDATRERCPYTLTVAEHQVDDLPPGFLTDRIVLVAVDLPGVEDSVLTPVHGRLAGGYLHAMALDNLMHRGGDYRHRNESRTRLASIAAGLGLCLLLAIILRGYRHGMPVVRWTLLSLAGIAVGLLTWLALNALSLPAPNWVVAVALFVFTAWRVTTRMRAPNPSQPGSSP